MRDEEIATILKQRNNRLNWNLYMVSQHSLKNYAKAYKEPCYKRRLRKRISQEATVDGCPVAKRW